VLSTIKQYAKNIIGWKTNRKLVVISVDDYGNVRLASSKARENIDNAGYKAAGFFDKYDTLETREDLEALYEVLSSVKDVHGNNAVMTPFAVPCNIDFEKMASENFGRYHYELLPETYAKLEEIDKLSYEGTWQMWNEGMRKGLMAPQFHGREHLSLKVFEEKLKERDQELLTVLQNRSFTALTSTVSNHIGQTSAFGFWDFKDNYKFKSIIEDGLNAFEKVYGYRSVCFNAPAGSEHRIIYNYLKEGGVKFVDTPLIKKEHQGFGKYKVRFNYTGKTDSSGIKLVVRNVVFEPTEDSKVKCIDLALNQIAAAFRWGKPAIISSHRVNFCGYIDPNNRKIGLTALKELLTKIVQRWPDVEFISAEQLGNIIENGNE